MSHQWHYLKKTLLNEEQVGPVPEAEFVEAIKSGQITHKSKVFSATRTRNQWAEAGKVPAVA